MMLHAGTTCVQATDSLSNLRHEDFRGKKTCFKTQDGWPTKMAITPQQVSFQKAINMDSHQYKLPWRRSNGDIVHLKWRRKAPHPSGSPRWQVYVWLVVSTLPLWKMMDFVSWDDDIPNCFWKVIKFHGSSHHQPDEYPAFWDPSVIRLCKSPIIIHQPASEEFWDHYPDPRHTFCWPRPETQ